MANPGVTEEQALRALEAFDATVTDDCPGGNINEAARIIGMNPNTYRNRLMRAREMLSGSLQIRAKSTLRKYEYAESGDVILEWEKATVERQIAAIREGIRGFVQAAPKIKTPKGPSKFDADVIPWFQIGDAHLGMLAHEAETGANFDLKIAERELCGAFDILFEECPARERCVINDLGDFTHYENFKAETEASGHRLDADTRFHKMIRSYARVMRFIVERALERFAHVDVIINQGNHSRTNDVWMAVLLDHVFQGERVSVLDNAGIFTPYRMGNTFCMTHHGDKTKRERLIHVMSNDYRQDWGETEFHYIDVGHLHHKERSKEDAGATVEQWNTLAPRDKYGNDGGWRAHQSITRVDRSREYGEIGRRVLPVKEVRAALARAHVDGYVPPERREVHTV